MITACCGFLFELARQVLKELQRQYTIQTTAINGNGANKLHRG